MNLFFSKKHFKHVCYQYIINCYSSNATHQYILVVNRVILYAHSTPHATQRVLSCEIMSVCRVLSAMFILINFISRFLEKFRTLRFFLLSFIFQLRSCLTSKNIP